MRKWLLLSFAASLSGCSLAPAYDRPIAVVPAQWPQGASYDAAQSGEAGMPWRSLITDAAMRTVIERALINNRDLRASVANVAAARAQYRSYRASRFPALSLGAGATAARGGQSTTTTADAYTSGISLSAFEIDLFGRLKNQSREAFEAYLATQSGARALRLTLVTETATAYVTLATDRELADIARQAEGNARKALELTQGLLAAGLTSDADVQAAITVLGQALEDTATYEKLAAQDRNALDLLVGGPVEDALLPASLASLDTAIGNVPAGLSSEVLLQRPDVLEAEHQLKGAYAGIGVAKAAFFPKITLTAAAGVASSALQDLFSGGWTQDVTGAATLPLLGGSQKAGVDYARAQKDYYEALYEQSVQSAFRDVSDALAGRATIVRQRQVEAGMVAAADRSYALARSRFETGAASGLDALNAQQALFAARQNEAVIRFDDFTNRLTLYEAIGSDTSLP